MIKPDTATNYSLNVNEIKDLINQITKNNNIKKWDLGAIASDNLSVQVDKGVSKQLKGSQKSSLTIRVWNKNNQIGITSTSDYSSTGLEKAFMHAYQASNFGNKDEAPDFSPLAKEKLNTSGDQIKTSLGITKILDLLKGAESQLISKHLAINSVPYNGISESTIERLYINSDDSIRQMIKSQAVIYLYAKAEEPNRKPRSSGSVKIGYGVNDLDIEACINEAADKTISHLNYKPIETGKYLICFSPEAFLDLINSFSNIFNARSILDGISLSTRESIGKKLAVPFLSICDDTLHPANIGSFSFDGEGTPTKKVNLIEKGILKNLLHSEFTARIFGVSPTGHAGLGAKVSVSPDWFVISKDKESKCLKPELIHNKTKQEFILIESLNALHAGVKSSQGSFSLPFDGWLVSNGKKTSIEAATIAGDIKSLLHNILQVETEQFITHQGVSPYVWVDHLSITGES